jgi:hypothetical protein
LKDLAALQLKIEAVDRASKLALGVLSAPRLELMPGGLKILAAETIEDAIEFFMQTIQEDGDGPAPER